MLVGDAPERVVASGGDRGRLGRPLVLGGGSASGSRPARDGADLVRQPDLLARLQPVGLLQVVQPGQFGHRDFRLPGQALDGVVAAHGDGRGDVALILRGRFRLGHSLGRTLRRRLFRCFLRLHAEHLAHLQLVGLGQAVEVRQIVDRHAGLARDRGQGVALGHRDFLDLA